MVCSSPELGAQGQPGSSEEEQRATEPDLMWLANLTGAHIGLAPIPQDPEDRCSIWENLVSLVDFQCPGFPLTSEELCHYIDIPRAPSSARSGAVPVTLPRAWSPPLPEDIDYKTNPHVRPPYSYATLICMAMEASEKPKLTLADICKWIRDNFSYFRRAHPSWQSAIRHNLCINKRFVKVPREKGEPGRGAFWKLHPQYAEWLKDSTFKGGRALAEHIPPASGRRAQPGAQSVPSPAASACSSQNSLEVGTELQQLLQEFEDFESSQKPDPVENQEGQQSEQPWPTPPAEASCVPSCESESQEEPGELTELKGFTDWEALLGPFLEQGDFSAPEQLQLSPSSQPGAFPLDSPSAEGQLLGWPQEQQQISPTELGLDETLTATAFLEAAWNEEIEEILSNNISVEQGAENIQASLPDGDLIDWDPLAHLDLIEI
ncbi:forkhead box protein J1-like [Parus major]|uniref:forkhead box protein J1-like n=1 Tax=Parus major TaxID=9157 RepID=UPI0007711E99|nr:forkhead box protein J1-like [Parus major]